MVRNSEDTFRLGVMDQSHVVHMGLLYPHNVITDVFQRHSETGYACRKCYSWPTTMGPSLDTCVLSVVIERIVFSATLPLLHILLRRGWSFGGSDCQPRHIHSGRHQEDHGRHWLAFQHIRHGLGLRKCFDLGHTVPGILLLVSTVIGCNKALAIALISLAVGSEGFVGAGYYANNLDVTGRFAGEYVGLRAWCPNCNYRHSRSCFWYLKRNRHHIWHSRSFSSRSDHPRGSKDDLRR